jgi:hypothetical protein
MREITLTRGMVALVDDEDFGAVSSRKWGARCSNGLWYARSGRGGKIAMHHFIMGSSEIIDHRDGNGLNNQRSNLRRATQAQNMGNRAKHKTASSSRYKGVCRHRNKWRATIALAGYRKHIGCFVKEEHAARAYDANARAFFGEFACVNFPLPGEHGAIAGQVPAHNLDASTALPEPPLNLCQNAIDQLADMGRSIR